MATTKIGWGLWLGGMALFWALYPLLFTQARGVLVLAAITALLALLGWLASLQFLVVWSGGLGLCNLTLALVLTSHPPDLWTGLSAGIILLALVDGSHRFTYVRHCWLAPGVVTNLLGTFGRLSGLSLAVGLLLGVLVLSVGQSPLSAAAPGLLTVMGACLLGGFLALFLLHTSRWPDG
jgi:hypothetical protein